MQAPKPKIPAKPKVVTSARRLRTKAKRNNKPAPIEAAPTAYSQVQRLASATITSNASAGSITVHKREFVASINGSVAFLVHAYRINPGLTATFPWLAPMANLYEQYKFKNIKFEYIPRVASTLSGSIIMAPDYDPSDGNPPLESVLTAFQGAVEDVIWHRLTCPLSPKSGDRYKYMYVRNSTIPFGQDPKLYDLGLFFVGVVGCADGSVIGKLWVEYDIELVTPQIHSVAPTPTPQFSSLAYIPTPNPDVSAWAANSYNVITDWLVDNAANALGLSVNNGVFSLPPGWYDVEFRVGFILDSSATPSDRFLADLRVFKNGAVLTPEIEAYDDIDGAATTTFADMALTITVRGIIQISAGDTLTCEGYLDFNVTSTSRKIYSNSCTAIFKLA